MKGISGIITVIHKADVGDFILTLTNDPNKPYAHISLQTRDRKLSVSTNVYTEEKLEEWLPIVIQMLNKNSTTTEPLQQISLPSLGKSLLSDI